MRGRGMWMRGVSMRGIGMRRRICMVLIEGVDL
jgi:hypothetical protein